MQCCNQEDSPTIDAKAESDLSLPPWLIARQLVRSAETSFAAVCTTRSVSVAEIEYSHGGLRSGNRLLLQCSWLQWFALRCVIMLMALISSFRRIMRRRPSATGEWKVVLPLRPQSSSGADTGDDHPCHSDNNSVITKQATTHTIEDCSATSSAASFIWLEYHYQEVVDTPFVECDMIQAPQPRDERGSFPEDERLSSSPHPKHSQEEERRKGLLLPQHFPAVAWIVHRSMWRSALVLMLWLALLLLTESVAMTAPNPMRGIIVGQWLLWIAAVVTVVKLQGNGPGYCALAQQASSHPNTQRRAVNGRTKPILVQVPFRNHGDITGAQAGFVQIWTRCCVTCAPSQALRPLRCGHCRLCGACVSQFDHHCLVLGCCIGRDNIRYFISFLLLCSAALIVQVGWAVAALDNGSRTHDRNIRCLVLLVVAALSSPIVVSGCGLYIYLYFVLGVTYREWRLGGEWIAGYELATRWAHIPRPFAGPTVWQNVKLFLLMYKSC